MKYPDHVIALMGLAFSCFQILRVCIFFVIRTCPAEVS